MVVVALHRRGGQRRTVVDASRLDVEVRLVPGGELDPPPGGGGVDDPVPGRPRAHLGQQHPLHLEAVLGAEHTEVQLGAELVEAVPGGVVHRGHAQEVAPDLDHLHAAADRSREVEDVLEATTVEHRGEAGGERGRQRGVEVMHVGGPLEARAVDRGDLGGPEEAQQRLGEGRRLVHQVRRRHAGEAGEPLGQAIGWDQQELAADGHGPLEADALPGSREEEVETLIGDAHAPPRPVAAAG